MADTKISNQISGGYPYNKYADYVALPSDIPSVSYYNGPNNDGIGATLTNSGTQAALVCDSTGVSNGDRILVPINSPYAGIYVVTDKGSPSTNYVLTRANDYNVFGKINFNDTVLINDGSLYNGAIFIMQTSGTGPSFVVGISYIQYIPLYSPFVPSQIYSPGYLFGGLIVKASDTTFNISPVWCVDNGNAYNINLPSGINVDMTTNGAGGLDSGTFTNDETYCVYLIGDTSNINPASACASLQTVSPTFPVGYNVFRFIGVVYSDTNTHLYNMTGIGNGLDKEYLYDFAVDFQILNAGTATTQTSIGTLSNFAPNNPHVAKLKFDA